MGFFYLFQRGSVWSPADAVQFYPLVFAIGSLIIGMIFVCLFGVISVVREGGIRPDKAAAYQKRKEQGKKGGKYFYLYHSIIKPRQGEAHWLPSRF